MNLSIISNFFITIKKYINRVSNIEYIFSLFNFYVKDSLSQYAINKYRNTFKDLDINLPLPCSR